MEVYSNDNRVKSLEKEVIMLKSAIFDIQQGKWIFYENIQFWKSSYYFFVTYDLSAIQEYQIFRQGAQ